MFPIYVNQSGYLPEKKKVCVATENLGTFSVNDMQGKSVFEGKFISFGFDALSGDHVYQGDFSSLTTPGTYRIQAGDKVSASFTIGNEAYDKLLYDVMRGFYFLRCGCELKEEHAGQFTHASCHTGEAMEWENHEVKKTVLGGWHDAGDYGRYVNAGAVALSHLLYAYVLYPNPLKNLKLNIPENGNGTPDVLNECRYELDWMLQMQREDGAVYHKLTTAHHAPFIMPEEDKAPLFLLPVCSFATADFAAVCALASRVFLPFDEAYSNRLFGAAKAAYLWLEKHPEFLDFRNPEGCGTGGYYERDDISNRWWASAEMYACTGDEKYLKDAKAQMKKELHLTTLGWGDVGCMGTMALLTSEYPVEEDVLEKLKDAVCKRAEVLRKVADGCGYGAAMVEQNYVWGSNMPLIHHGMLFALADWILGKKEYAEYALSQLHVLMGVNALGISYVTGNGEYAYNYPHLRPAQADGIEECMPGMVSGGPNRHLNDRDYSKELLQVGTPPMKCFVDDWRCYSLNEITIYWNSPVVFLIAAVLN